MLHKYAARFDVTGNLKYFAKYLGNKQDQKLRFLQHASSRKRMFFWRQSRKRILYSANFLRGAFHACHVVNTVQTANVYFNFFLRNIKSSIFLYLTNIVQSYTN